MNERLGEVEARVRSQNKNRTIIGGVLKVRYVFTRAIQLGDI